MEINVEDKELSVVLKEAKFDVVITAEAPMQVNVGESAKIEVGQAIDYIKSGEAEINAAVTAGTNAFNANATAKTNAFNQNATDKTTAFNNNATNKTNTFNQNATDKTLTFNTNAAEKQAAVDASAALAKQYAIGDPTEPLGNSAKYWAEQASSELSSLTSRVSSIEGKIPSTASSSNQLADKSYVDTADNNLQSQIDAIVSSSDVFDVVGTYAELQAYDITTVPVNDIVKVLNDSSHGGAATYYRCIETAGVKSWSYIGSEGASYTKGEADAKFSTILATGSSLDYLNDILTLKNAQGTALSSVTIQASAQVDNKSITKNSSDQLQTVGVINQNDTTTALKTWSGSKAQYDAIVTKDANTEYFCTDSGELYLGDVKIGSSGGLEIGDIGIAPLGIDESENKRRYLNGQVISQAQFVSFTDKLKSIVALYPNLATTEVNWQAAVTNSALGQCGQFVIDDDAGTIRLPKVVNINGLQDLTGLGGIKAESLPNITGRGYDQLTDSDKSTISTTGAFGTSSNYSGYKLTYASLVTSSDRGSLDFDASRSSSTYQDDAPVQQEAVQYPYFIQVATGVETSIDVSREIELNNPFSLLDYKYSEYELSNASWLLSNGQWNSGAVYQSVYNLLLQIYNGTVTKAGVSVKLSTETYTDTDFVLNTGDTTFRLPLKVALASGKAVAGNGMTLGLTDGTNNAGLSTLQNTREQYLTGYSGAYGKSAGSSRTGTLNISPVTTIGITTDPLKSGIETSANGLYLYFYVGEVVQDANIIAAGQALTDIADLKNASNFSSIGKETIVGWGMPDYSAGVSIANGTTIVKDGFIAFRTNSIKNTERTVYINGNKLITGAWGSTVDSYIIFCFPVSKNDIITFDSGSEVKFYPMKGVN